MNIARSLADHINDNYFSVWITTAFVNPIGMISFLQK